LKKEKKWEELFYSSCFDICGIFDVITTRAIHTRTMAIVIVPPRVIISCTILGIAAGFCIVVKNGGYDVISPFAIWSMTSIITPPHNMIFNQLIFKAVGIFFLNTVVIIPVAIGVIKHAIFYLLSICCFIFLS
jgi:hypothetical protein